MSLTTLALLDAAAAAPDGPPALLQFLPLVAMGVAMWFLFLRPQMRQQKERQTKLNAIRKGDMVLTGGGLLGKVVRVDETYADIDLGSNLKVKALKSTIADVIPPGGVPAAND